MSVSTHADPATPGNQTGEKKKCSDPVEAAKEGKSYQLVKGTNELHDENGLQAKRERPPIVDEEKVTGKSRRGTLHHNPNEK